MICVRVCVVVGFVPGHANASTYMVTANTAKASDSVTEGSYSVSCVCACVFVSRTWL